MPAPADIAGIYYPGERAYYNYMFDRFCHAHLYDYVAHLRPLEGLLGGPFKGAKADEGVIPVLAT